MDKIFFKEEQKFGSVSLYISMGLIYVAALSFVGYSLVNHFVLKGDFIEGHMDEKGLIIISIIIPIMLLFFAYLLFGSKLKVEITDSGIKYSFKPLIRKNVFIPKENIESWEIRKYRPIIEYGGWGVKPSHKKRHRNKRHHKVDNAISVGGNIGLQIVMLNKDRLLIGTQRSDAIKRAMNKLIIEKGGEE